jgi:hypothetical protein
MRTFFESRTDLSSRYIEGTVAEIEELFGSPVPELPEGHHTTDEGETLVVDLYPGLRNAFRAMLEHSYRTLAEKRGKDDATEGAFAWDGGPGTPYSRFEEMLHGILANLLERERRLGLLNLFWLAHARDAAEVVSNVQVTTVERGGLVRGADVGTIRRGRLTITVTAETVAGTLVGGAFKVVEGGNINVSTTIGTVKEGGEVTGVKIDSVG